MLLSEPLVIVTGCPRSGTGYMSQYFQVLGLQVGHEKLRRNGMSYWLLADKRRFDAYNVKASRKGYGDLRLAKKFHVTRHPLHMISSMLPRHESILRGYVPDWDEYDTPLVRTAKFWVSWNEKIQYGMDIDLRLKVEEAPEQLDNICRVSRLLYHDREIRKVKQLDTRHNTAFGTGMKAYDEVFSWSKLWWSIPRSLYRRVKDLAREYGYKE